MKTIYYLIAFCFCIQYNSKAQANFYRLDEFETEPVIKKNVCDGLKPVYYNFSKRRLYSSNKMPLNGRHFLDLCRGINDERVELQIRRYDQLSANKRKLVTATIICGVGGYLTFIGSVMNASSGYSHNGSPYVAMGIGAAALFIATPILAISTGIPHQKRKEILFRDLPEAYNFHVAANP